LVSQGNLFPSGVAENVRAKLARQTLVSARDLLPIRDRLREQLINSGRPGPSHVAHGAGIGRYQQNAFDRRLRDEQTIEGVLVDRRQIGDGNDVLAAMASSS